MRKLVFQDTEKFYRELKVALEQDEPVEVITDYQRYSDLPERLKSIFELHKHKSGTWVNLHTGAFVPSAAAFTAINYNALYQIAAAGGAAGVGAIVGGFVGGPVGVALGGVIGATVGATVGAMAFAISNKEHDVEIKIKRTGEIWLRISPINQRKSKS
ncbi:hypothetical protein IQ264_17895 [Phormidium sp. LEGE 05292]|uniref:hypothetical protein n=1 Tax=[Phormidium] sp. LEGE 05292 TaxID=767427 RepID=UPI001882D830|nr:hypothetical protein [Phormidium sp. LEGE 05292]MBE9227302.1 hypothetical protein [Phormidium sp. LEGE 05292]